MMTTAEVATAIGVRPVTIYRAIKRTRMRLYLRKVNGQYEFSNDDVIYLARTLKRRNVGHLVRTLTPNSYAHDTSHATRCAERAQAL